MAIKPNARTCWLREQTIEDLPSGLTLRLEAHEGGTRLMIAGRVLPRWNREILFDTDGRAVRFGPAFRKVPM
jgi:hypothetical protein